MRTSDRSAERHNVTESAKLGTGFELIYAHLSGKAPKYLKPFGSRGEIDTAAHKQIATVGHTFSSDLPDVEHLEDWTIENESILGARLLRDIGAGERIGNNQLIALRTKDAKAFMLGTVSWRSVTRNGQLKMGVQYLPGVPQAVKLKTQDKEPAGGTSIAAILLPAITALKIPSSLIIPRDIFKANLQCEMVTSPQEKFKITMGFSVYSGVDFERISYTQVEAQ